MPDDLQGKSDNTVNDDEVAFDFDSFLEVWLEATIKTTTRRQEAFNNKRKKVLEFFMWLGKSPEMTLPIDVRNWSVTLKRKKLATATIHSRLAALSSFFNFLLSSSEHFGNLTNPVKGNYPKRSKSFRLEAVNVLSAEELSSLIDVVKKYSLSDKALYLRDYAMLQIFIVTSWSRQEVLDLTGENIKITDENIFLISPKGEMSLNKKVELSDESAKNSLLAYLKATGRDESVYGTSNPLWLRHDNGSINTQNLKLTSHAIAIRMKLYADYAGIKDFHLHKLRWTKPTVITIELARQSKNRVKARKELCDTNFNVERTIIIEKRFSNLLYKRASEKSKKLS